MGAFNTENSFHFALGWTVRAYDSASVCLEMLFIPDIRLTSESYNNQGSILRPASHLITTALYSPLFVRLHMVTCSKVSRVYLCPVSHKIDVQITHTSQKVSPH